MASAPLIVTEKVWLAEFDAESVTWTVKLALPAVGVAPDTRPPLERLSPTAARLPLLEVTDQVSPAPVPPEVAIV